MSRSRQDGQAAIYGLFVIVGSVVALFFLFNTGQLSAEKTRLVNTSDAVVYSGAVMNARTLNYEAYANRAMLANTVAIAQLVSLSSWIQYVETMGTMGAGVNWMKYIGYYPSYLIAETSGDSLGHLNDEYGDVSALEGLALASDKIIRMRLMKAQQVAYMGLIPARLKVMREVAESNYRDDGDIAVDPLSLSASDITSFVSRYADDERTRFAEVSKTAASRDAFVPRRNWTMPALYPEGCVYMWDWISRRGGTDLIGFDEWKALDAMSEFRWKTDKYGDCYINEYPVGFGGRGAADVPGSDTDLSRYGAARLVNPTSGGMAYGAASSSTWDYSGLPDFYDLSDSALAGDDPRLRLAVRLRRVVAQTRTSEGRAEIRGSGSGTRLGQSLNNFSAMPAGGDELVAVSAAEVFFARQDANAYGTGMGKPREIGSLFNPFWQPRLVSADAEVRFAQGLQGVEMP
ncbi:hypothetical protein J5J83_14975 [Azoarcus sp. L1K30]|uniref:pilus assembly protein TadG-related protein n=1 Tax=Azoarcus sp. L1K30 TaxID=2820277 RepID=UPI001B829504|nr:hypothetical protein [Azoarcus sp. L1K30]